MLLIIISIALLHNWVWSEMAGGWQGGSQDKKAFAGSA